MKPGLGLVVRGSSERLAATVVPAIVTAAALLPLILTGTIAGQEIAHPIAVIVLGGLVTSTLVVTFLIRPSTCPRSTGGRTMQRRNLTALLLLLVVVGVGATACGYSAPAEGRATSRQRSRRSRTPT